MTKHTPARVRGIVAVRAEGDGSDPKALLAKLTKTFEEFKEENDKEIQALKKGQEDVVQTEKVDRINDAVSEVKDQLEKAIQANEGIKTDLQSRADDLEARLNRIKLGGAAPTDAVRSEAENAAEFFSVMNGHTVKPDEADVEAYREYRNTFSQYLRRGDAAGRDVRAAMSVGSDPDGGYFVVPERSSQIITKLFETSPMRQIAGSVTIGTDAIEFPLDNNDATSGGWVGETASRGTTATPQIGVQRIPVHEQYANPEVTQKLLDDAQFDVEQWLTDKTADKMMRTENTAFVTGTGVGQPTGFVNYSGSSVTTDDDTRAWGVLQHVVTGASGGFPTASGIAGASDPDALITTVSKLNPSYRDGAVWTMNRATEAAVRKLKDGDGRYLVGFGDIERNANRFVLFGYPIVNFEDMADIQADSFSMAFGNFRVGYLVVDRQGIRLLRDPFTNKPYIRFYTTKRVGGDVVNSDAIKLVKFSA